MAQFKSKKQQLDYLKLKSNIIKCVAVVFISIFHIRQL